MALLNFNAAEIATDNYEVIPPGLYEAIITESEMQANKAGTGAYLKLTFTITSGSCKGRLLWDRLNLNNPSAKAVEIARQQLANICRAVNVLSPRDSTQLHNLPLRIKVIIRDYNGEEKNEIKGYYPPEDRQRADAAEATVTPPEPEGAPW